jgi:hypothetical protein
MKPSNQKSMKKYLTISILAAALFGSCYYDVEEELYPTLECTTTGATYTAVVEPIIRANCYNGCHSAASNIANITLEGYENLKVYVDNGRLLGSIKHGTGFSAMPKNAAKLLDCNIAKIEAWINAGAPQ